MKEPLKVRTSWWNDSTQYFTILHKKAIYVEVSSNMYMQIFWPYLTNSCSFKFKFEIIH
jgi:hypothetical protein